MRRRIDVYERFKELFRVVPCMLVKSHEQLLEDEVRCYPDPSCMDPTLLGFSTLGGEGMDLARVLDTASDDGFFRGQEKHWNDGAQDMVAGIASLVGNFPPKGDAYKRRDSRTVRAALAEDVAGGSMGAGGDVGPFCLPGVRTMLSALGVAPIARRQ